MMPRQRFHDGLQPFQVEVLSDFDQGINRFYMLEWPRRHRKTTLVVNLLSRDAVKYPKTKWLYVAPTKVECREIVWDDPTMLREALSDEMPYKLNEQHMTVKYANGSIIQFGGGDNPDSLRGIDACGVVFDEWALHVERCWTEVLMPVIMGEPPYPNMRRWAMFLYTPKGINHATRMFDKACKGKVPNNGAAKDCEPLWFVSRLNAEKVGFMSAESLAIAKLNSPTQYYDQEYLCSRITDEARTLITSGMLEGLKQINWKARQMQRIGIRKIVSIDPAFGGDRCVVMGIEDGEILDTKSLAPLNTAEIILEAKRMASEINTRNFIGDCIGNGKGVMDGLTDDAANYSVQHFCSAEESNDALCANRRAEAYFYASSEIRARNAAPIMDNELLRQLPIASRYLVRNRGKMLIQPKDIIKKELGCSPDLADAYVMGTYGLKHVDPVRVNRQVKYRDSSYDESWILEMAL